MTDFDFKVNERVTRQAAAERLMDIAYALAAGAPLELRADAGRVSIPVADELRLERESRSTARRIELDLQLDLVEPVPPGSGSGAHRLATRGVSPGA